MEHRERTPCRRCGSHHEAETACPVGDRASADLGIAGIGQATLVGRGAYAKVFRATQSATGQDIAVKVFTTVSDTEAGRQRLAAEREAMIAVSAHPDAVTILDTGVTAEGHPYILMEYVEGGTLHERLAAEGPMDPAEVVRIGSAVAAALHSAHESGITHGDISPSNVLLTADGAAKLSDFGMARLHAGSMTRTGTVTTAVAYAPPEVLTGEKPDTRGDIYALGATLYAALAGAPAFFDPADESLMPLIGRIASMPVPDLSERGVPTSVAAVVEKAMAKAPGDRYPDGGALRGALESAAVEAGLLKPPADPTGPVAAAVTGEVPAGSETSVGASPPPDPEPEEPTKRSTRRITAVLVGAAALALIATAAFAFRQDGTGTPSTTVPATTVVTVEPVSDTSTTTSTVVDEAPTARHPSIEAFSGDEVSIDFDDMGPRSGLARPEGIEMVEDPNNGRATIGDDAVVYRSDDGHVGRDEFTIRLCYADETCIDIVVTILLTRSPQAPVAENDRAETEAGEPVTIPVLANDADGPEPDPATLRIVRNTPPTEGRAVVDRGAGAVVFHPAEDFEGTATFTYAVSSERGYSASAEVTVVVTPGPETTTTTTTTTQPPSTPEPPPPPPTVEPPDDPPDVTEPPEEEPPEEEPPPPPPTQPPPTTANIPPEAEPDNFSFTFSSSVCLPVLSNDRDDDGDPLTVATFTQPTVGHVQRDSGCGSGGLRYIPEDRPPGYNTSFSYTASDGTETDSTSVSITITY